MYEDPAPGALSLRALHDRLYAGAILRFADVPEMQHIVALTRGFVEDRFHPHDPQQIHRLFGEGELAEKIAAVQRGYSRSDEVKQAWRSLFVALGFDPEGVARDRLMLRFQLHREPDTPAPWHRNMATVGFHRDTWGTNLYAQVNWWAPVYPITAGRTFAFHPALWAQPLANSSAEFDMAEAMRLVRENKPSLKRGDIVPIPLAPVDPEGARPVVIDCGSIIAFSSQHAHAGVPNHTGLTRISLETRTLLIDDLRAGRGAPNVDGQARWMALALFRRLGDGKPLAEVLGVAPLVPFEGPIPA